MMFKPPSPAGFIGDNPTHPPLKLRGGERRGYALLLAVLILSTVLAGATALANIVISGIRQTREVSNSIIAYAAAESDVEQALYVLRKTGDAQLQRGEYIVGGVQRKVEDAEPVVKFSVKENDFISLPMIPTSSTSNITIPSWSYDQSCATSWIEVSRVNWDSSFTTNRQPFAHPGQNAMILFEMTPNTVELRIRALYCDINELKVDGLASRIIIKSTAEVAGAKQAIEVAVPREAPASGLFDFVLFSEEDLTKDVK